MRVWLVVLSFAVLPMEALAVPASLETRLGNLSFLQSSATYETDINLNAVRLTTISESVVQARGFSWKLENDLVLLTLSSRGASCCTSFMIVDLTGDEPFLTRQFALHGFAPSSFDLSGTEFRFRLERFYPPNVDHWLVTYSGGQPEVSVVMEDDTGVMAAGGGDAVLRWIGKATYEFFEAADERQRFRRLLSEEVLNELRSRLMTAQPIQKSGQFVYMSGCKQRSCADRHAVIALDTSSNVVSVAMIGCRTETYGSPLDQLPIAVTTLIAEREAMAAASSRCSSRGD